MKNSKIVSIKLMLFQWLFAFAQSPPPYGQFTSLISPHALTNVTLVRKTCCGVLGGGRLFIENVNISLEVSSLAKVCHTSHVIIMVFSFCRTSPAIFTIHLPIFYETRCRRTSDSLRCFENQYIWRGGILKLQSSFGLMRWSDTKTNGIWKGWLLVGFIVRGVLSALYSEW